MTDEKKVTPLVEPAAVISQAIPAMMDATMAVVSIPTADPILSQAPAMVATDAKPTVDKPKSVVAPTLFEKK